MFIRETYKKSKGRKKYVQHQLIESIRTPSGPRQHIVLNLGKLSIDQEKHKALANAIEGILNNQSLLFSEDPEITAKAKHFAGVITKQRLANAQEQPEEVSKKLSPQYERVDVDSIVLSEAKTIGAEHVALSQMQDYGLEKILRDLDFTQKQVTYAQFLIAGKMIHPSSERETVRWLKDTSGLEELLGSSVKIYDQALQRVAVLLWKHHVEIERRLAQSAREIFSLEDTIVLYDLTNTYFEGSKRGSRIAKPGGKSKERRNDCPLVTLSLTVDAEGFPKQSKLWQGNVSEPATLKYILAGLKAEEPKGLLPEERTIVMDAGIASEENIRLIKEYGYRYVVVSRKMSYEDSFWKEANAEQILLADEKTMLELKLVRTESEAFLLCHSEAKEVKEKAILSKKMQCFEEALSALRDGLSKKGTCKKHENILERIGRLKERYGVGNLYTIQVEEKDAKAINIKFEKNEKGFAKEEKVGTYVLRTNRLDLSAENISKIHRSLTTIEDCFCNMKQSLGLRPSYHHTDIPTIAHIHLSVLAYHMLAGILKRLRGEGIRQSWWSLRNALNTHMRVTTTMNTDDEHILTLRTCTTPTAAQQTIYNKLKIKQTPLNRGKIKSSIKTQRCSVEKKK